MAEEVQINNVGGEGVASEVTLANLLSVTEKMARKAGIDPKDVNKKLTQLSKATEDTVKIVKVDTKEKGKNTKELTKSTSALKKFSSGLSGTLFSSISALAKSTVGLASALTSGREDLTSFASQLPLIGSGLSLFTGLIDEQLDSFRELSQVGALFGGTLSDLRHMSASAGLPLSEFTDLVTQNSQSMRLFGGSTMQGAKNFAALSKELRGGPGRSFISLGFTAQELNESLIDYAEFSQRQIGTDRRNNRLTAQSAANYLETIDELAAVTGKRRDQIKEEMNEALNDARSRAAMARMTKEQATQFAGNLAVTPAALKDMIKDMADDIPNNELTKGFYTLSETFRTQAGDIENMSAREYNNFLAKVGREMDAAGLEMGAGLDAIIGNGGAIGSALASSTELAAFQQRTEAEQQKINEERSKALLADQGIKSFSDTIRNIRTDLMATLTLGGENSPLSLIQNAMNTVAGKLNEFVTSEVFTTGIANFTAAFKEDPKQAIQDLFSKGTAALTKVIKDFFLGANVGPEKDGIRSGGFLDETLKPMMSAAGDALVEGVTAWWDESSGFTKAMVIGAGVLFAGGGPLALAMAAGATKMMGRAALAMIKPGITPGATAGSPTVGRDPKTGKFTKLPAGGKGSMIKNIAKLGLRGAKFIPGVGLVAAGAMGAFDAVSGFNADPNASFGKKLGNAGSSALSGLTFGLLGSNPDEIAANAANGNANGATSLSSAELATVNNPTLQENIDALKSLDASSVTSYTEAVEGLVEALNKLNEELSRDNDTMFTSRADAGELLNGINASSSGTSEGTKQLNSTMHDILIVLRQIKDFEEKVASNTKNITGGNIARGGVSTIGP